MFQPREKAQFLFCSSHFLVSAHSPKSALKSKQNGYLGTAYMGLVLREKCELNSIGRVTMHPLSAVCQVWTKTAWSLCTHLLQMIVLCVPLLSATS